MLNGALLAWEYHEVYFDMCGIEKRLQRQPRPPRAGPPSHPAPPQILCAVQQRLPAHADRFAAGWRRARGEAALAGVCRLRDGRPPHAPRPLHRALHLRHLRLWCGVSSHDRPDQDLPSMLWLECRHARRGWLLGGGAGEARLPACGDDGCTAAGGRRAAAAAVAAAASRRGEALRRCRQKMQATRRLEERVCES